MRRRAVEGQGCIPSIGPKPSSFSSASHADEHTVLKWQSALPHAAATDSSDATSMQLAETRTQDQRRLIWLMSYSLCCGARVATLMSAQGLYPIAISYTECTAVRAAQALRRISSIAAEHREAA